ncbi:MAG: T9SS type A sorting domain-containing protein [Flavobacteriales bacterium]|nr:T9SS type A sorting domain-containing protein [Flavobacteriales bacterium]
MRSSRLFLIIGLLFASLVARAQGESLRALSTRPAEGMARAKSGDGVKRHFNYLFDTLQLPLMDDFSIDRTRKRNATQSDPDVTFDHTVYRLEVAGVSTPDMRFSTDTTYRTEIDASEPPQTTRIPLPSLMVTVRDLSVYPPTSREVEAWPAYHIRDSITAPPPDTIRIQNPPLIQDSLLVYDVAPAEGTYIMNGVPTPLILWQDDDVYINGTYPVDPPTIGVATFDGLARTGYPYDFANYTSYGRADKLTSVPINLDYPASDSIYLSFFYQAKGLSGDTFPQVGDSLLLEFYAPLEQSWYRAWGIPYVDQAPFWQVLIPIKEARFLKQGFQFRFVNYATLSGSFDHWHLDYVRLGRQRAYNDVILVDVAYVSPEASILQTYTSVPFAQFNTAPGSLMAQQVVERVRNLDILDRLIQYSMTARNEDGGAVSAYINGVSPNGNAARIIDTNHPINSAPNFFVYDNSPSTDAALWDVRFLAEATPDINQYNDTMRLRQELSNYYSYDDGSAEMGYSLNTAGAKLAYRFDLIGPDSLRAVRMYFNPIANQPPDAAPGQGSFLLTVWSSLSPEVILHQNYSFSSPEYRLDGINKFVEYPLDSTIRVEGTIYVGWVQTSAVKMNLGFDRNRNNRTKISYNVGGGFQNTSFNGSLMMRPVMVSAVDPWAGIGEHEAAPGELLIFPNPASDVVRIAMNGDMPARATVQCLDATGRVVWSERMTGTNEFSTAAIANGMYVVRVLDAQGTLHTQGRMVVQH